MNTWKRIAHLDRHRQRRLQEKKLRHFVRRHLYPFSPHYRRVFDEAGIDPRSIRTLDDLRRVPLSSKADLVPPDQPVDTTPICSLARRSVLSAIPLDRAASFTTVPAVHPCFAR